MAEVSQPLELAIVGAGPTASSFLERLVASAPELLGGRALRVHLVDPHQAGTGRVWRPDLDARLWMNSMAEDVTMFTDGSVRCDGPIRPGPSLYEWSQEVDEAALAALAPPDLAAEIRGLAGMTFPTRRVQSAYLEWFHRRVLGGLPAGVEVVAHARRAIDVQDVAEAGGVEAGGVEAAGAEAARAQAAGAGDGRQRVVLDGGAPPLEVDAVVLALGHLDAEPDATGAAHRRFAASHRLAYVPPGHTADQDLSVLEPGADVVVGGFGQAFTDLVVLVTEGRGGRFVRADDGHGLRTVGYEPSGREPILHVGSRRGVPYRCKLDYRLLAPRAPLPRFLDGAAFERLAGLGRPLEFGPDLLPLVLQDVGWAYYHELFAAHPERTTGGWDDFAAAYAALGAGQHDEVDGADELDALVASAVLEPTDRLDLLSLDRPLAGCRFGSLDDLQVQLRRHVAADVARRTDPTFSADLGAFWGLLISFGGLGRLVAAGLVSPRSVVEDIRGWWFSFFMYVTSGPPPERLRQLLALADAGLVRFVGADTVVDADGGRGRFVARSASHPDEVVAEALIDARIATPSVSRSTGALLRNLQSRGEIVEEVVTAGPGTEGSGWRLNTGRAEVSGPDLRLARADGSAHPRRHGLGAFTNRPAAGAFARPGTNAPAFRQNDTVARSVLRTLAALGEPAETVKAGAASN